MAVIRKRKGKKGVKWFAEVRRVGHSPQRKTFATQAEAKTWARDIESDMDKGKRHSSGKHTLGWLIDEYQEEKNLTTYGANMLEAWRDRLGDRRITELHREDFLKARRTLQKEISTRGRNKGEPLTPSTVNKRMAAVSAVLTWGMDEHPREVELNPARLRALETNNARDPIAAGWTEDTGKAVLAACKAHYSPTLYPFVMLAMVTGARAGELRKLRWSDITLDADRGVVRFINTKNGDDRGIPFRGEALDVMREWKRTREVIGNGFVFYNVSDTALGMYNYRVHWGQARTAAGAEGFTFHDLRHVMASTNAMKGISLAMVGEALGHRSAQMTKRYSHYSTDSLDEIADVMADKVGTPVAKTKNPL